MLQKITSIEQIYEMLGLFYANKHLYEKVRNFRRRKQQKMREEQYLLFFLYVIFLFHKIYHICNNKEVLFV